VVALSAYFQAPEKIAAIILVAPAVFPKTRKPSKPQTDPPDSAHRIPFWKLPFLWAKQAALAAVSAVKWVVRQFWRGLGVLGLVLAAIVVRSRLAMWAVSALCAFPFVFLGKRNEQRENPNFLGRLPLSTSYTFPSGLLRIDNGIIVSQHQRSFHFLQTSRISSVFRLLHLVFVMAGLRST
jgi:pimeloyl-ACP methyl ester carboxylesterase